MCLACNYQAVQSNITSIGSECGDLYAGDLRHKFHQVWDLYGSHTARHSQQHVLYFHCHGTAELMGSKFNCSMNFDLKPANAHKV